jgi:hypothetical protein
MRAIDEVIHEARFSNHVILRGEIYEKLWRAFMEARRLVREANRPDRTKELVEQWQKDAIQFLSEWG